MKYISPRIRIYIGFIIAILLLCSLAFESYQSILHNRFNDNWISHTHKVMESNEHLATYLTDAESNQRGYLITGKKDFLDFYNKNKVDFSKENELLKSLTIDNPSQQVSIDSINHLAYRRLNILDRSINERNTQGLQALSTAQSLIVGKKTMDSIHKLSDHINDEEQSLLKKRQLAASNNTTFSQLLFFLSIVVTAGLLSVAFSMLYRQYKLKKIAQKDLYNSKEWYSQTLVSLGDGVIATSPDHHITYMNKAAEELTLYKSSEALLLPIETVFDIKNELTGNKIPIRTRQAIAQQKLVEPDSHTILTKKDGTDIYIDDSASPVYDINGKLLGAVLVFRDITEKTYINKHLKELNEELEETVIHRTLKLEEEIQTRKKAEEEKTRLIENLVDTNKSLEQFIYIISHNFRRPVANILGLLSLIERDQSDMEREHDLNYLSTEINQLDMVLKDLGKITSVLKNQTEHKEIIPVKEALDIIIESFDYETSKVSAQINNHVKTDDRVYGIKSYVNSIILNLISNAIKYKEPGRPLIIDIVYCDDDTNDILSIKDNGLGIDMEKHGDKIFGLYNRFHAHIEGKGLGLHISKTQMEMMGGKIKLHSKPGEGSDFGLYFPKHLTAVASV